MKLAFFTVPAFEPTAVLAESNAVLATTGCFVPHWNQE